MDLKEIYELMEKFESSSIATFELETENYSLRLGKSAAAAPVTAPVAAPVVAATAAVQAEAAPAAGESIASPLVGTFYRASSPEAAPFVTDGQHVKKGETVGLVEAMKMINEIPAPYDCVIEKTLADDGQLVEFGQPIFSIRKD